MARTIPLQSSPKSRALSQGWLYCSEDYTIVAPCAPPGANVGGRSGKQCRERWYNHLSPAVNKAEWSAEEDAAILLKVHEMGTRRSRLIGGAPQLTSAALPWWSATARRMSQPQGPLACGARPPLRTPEPKVAARSTQGSTQGTLAACGGRRRLPKEIVRAADVLRWSLILCSHTLPMLCIARLLGHAGAGRRSSRPSPAAPTTPSRTGGTRCVERPSARRP